MTSLHRAPSYGRAALCALFLLSGCSDVHLDLGDVAAERSSGSGAGGGDPGQGQGGAAPEPELAWQWNNPRPSGNHLLAIDGTSESDIWAVGEMGTVIRYDGTAWRTAYQGDPDVTFFDVAAVAPNSVWILGKRGDASELLHFDGTKWVSDFAIARGKLQSIWAADQDHVYALNLDTRAAGGSNRQTVYEWTGSTWQSHNYFTEDPSMIYRRIWGTGRDDIWLLGEAGVCSHFDGDDWERCSLGIASGNLLAATEGPDGHVWILVDQDANAGHTAQLEFYRVGPSRAELAHAETYGHCRPIKGAPSADSALLRYPGGALTTTAEGTMVATTNRETGCDYHFVDGVWTEARRTYRGYPQRPKLDLWASPKATYSVGPYGRIERLTKPRDTPTDAWPLMTKDTAAKLSHPSSTEGALYAIGYEHGSQVFPNNTPFGVMRQRRGSWEPLGATTFNHLTGLAAIDDEFVVAADYAVFDAKGPGSGDDIKGMRLRKFDGSTWSTMTDLPGFLARSLWADSREELWLGGFDGTRDAQTGLLYRSDGQSWWRDESYPTRYVPFSIFGLPTGERYVAGCLRNAGGGCDDIAILQHDGAWTVMHRFEPDKNHHAYYGYATNDAAPQLWATGPTDIWLSGRPGLHFDGQSWQAPPFGDYANIAWWGTGPSDVWMLSSADEYFANGASLIRHWDGSAISTAKHVSRYTFLGLGGSSRENGWAVGVEGTTMHLSPLAGDDGVPK